MDHSIVAVEDNHRISNTVAPAASKPLGSLIQINSIAIDISCAMEEIEESPMHEHFSIRGFVAGIREKDWKVCLPFDSDNDDVLMDNLPPLSIPKSQWWQCSHCVPDIRADERTAIETPLVNRNDVGTSSCPDGEQDGLFLHNIVQRTGEEHKSRDSGQTEGDNGPNNKIMNHSVRSIEGHKATISSREKTDRAWDNDAGNVHGRINETNPVQIRERHQISAVDNASSGSEDAVSLSAAHRRKRKLRSLADIMYEERNSTCENSRMRSASSSGTQVKSTEIEASLDHSDAPVDVTKSTKSPQRKRKSTLEEDRGPSETMASGKRLKGSILDSEKTCRRVEMSNSASEGNNASACLQVQHNNAKIQKIKPKKKKSLDVSKKTRLTHTDNRTVQNMQKHIVSSETHFGNPGSILSAVGRGEMEPYFPSFQSEKQVDRISYLSKGKRPIAEADDSPLMPPPSKTTFGERNIQRDVALELSLSSSVGAERNADNHISFRQQHSSIPDLNESFTEKTSAMQGKQLSTVSEKRSLIPNRTLDMLAACSKEGKRKLGGSQPQGVQSMNSIVESEGGLDDIPMEIVELLAKNQRERALGNSRQHIPYKGIHGSMRAPPPPAYLDGHPSMFNFPSRNSVSFTNNEMGRGILNFPQPKKCRLDTGNLDGSQFRLFSSFTPNRQRKMHYSAPNNVIPSAPRPSEGSDLLWLPRSKNAPFHLNVAPNCSIPPNTFGGMQPFPDHCYKGKMINDSKGKGKIVREASEGRKSLDAYSNDTIPAMQLLSLMDRGIVSPGSSFKVGNNSFLDKPFSPCSHHPLRLNGNENPNSVPLHNAATFSQGSHGKNFPGLLNGVCFPSENLKKPYSRGQMLQEQGHSKGIHFPGPSKVAIQPLRENLSLGVCALNRNPADFTVPDAGNKYMISAKDLKPRKRNALKERPHLENMEGQKRQRAKKDVSRKGFSRK